MSKLLQQSDIANAASNLGCEVAAVKAVIAVESSGSGFLPDGRPKILFEGHIFWRELKKRGVDPAPIAVGCPSILYKSWTKIHYKGGGAEYARLEQASAIHKEAALCASSWGLFQIMGFNHKRSGFDTVEQFVSAMEESEGRQLDAFCAYLKAQGIDKHLISKNWAAFAKAYNGPGYAVNRYDMKLAAAYKAAL